MLNIELMIDLFDILQFIFFVDGIVLRREDFSNIAIFLTLFLLHPKIASKLLRNGFKIIYHQVLVHMQQNI